MTATGWICRIALAALIVIILTVGVGLGWVSIPRPGLVFYAAAAFVGLLVWCHFQGGGRKYGPRNQSEADETSVPAHQDSITKG